MSSSALEHRAQLALEAGSGLLLDAGCVAYGLASVLAGERVAAAAAAAVVMTVHCGYRHPVHSY